MWSAEQLSPHCGGTGIIRGSEFTPHRRGLFLYKLTVQIGGHTKSVNTDFEFPVSAMVPYGV